MNNKFYVSLETARLLKEKGYDEECTTLYDCVFEEIIPAISVGLYGNGCIKNDYYCSCPTKVEAIDWLENKGIVIEVFCARIGENRKWCYSIINTKTDITIETPYKFLTRLEAEEVAIIKALELL